MKNKHYTYLLIIAMFLWGGGWSALKILTYTQPMDVIIFWRFFLMSLSFLPILYFFKIPLNINRKNTKYILASSVLNIAFMVFSFLGIKNGLAGAGSVIITTLSPIMTFILIIFIFKKSFNLSQYIGFGIGLLGGIIMLELTDMTLFLNGSNIYFLLAALVWGGVTILSQHSHSHIHPVQYSFAISLVATLVSFIYAFDSDIMGVLNESYIFWIALVYLAVLGQSVATTIFFMASGKLGSETTSSFMFLVPVFALFIAWLILDEVVQSHIVYGGLISIIAIIFINKTK